VSGTTAWGAPPEAPALADSLLRARLPQPLSNPIATIVQMRQIGDTGRLWRNKVTSHIAACQSSRPDDYPSTRKWRLPLGKFS
jgi:hypothetical protein